MILDTIDNLQAYTSLNPYFTKVVEFINSHDLCQLQIGKHTIDGDNLYLNIVDSPIKAKDEALLETHRAMIDIQIPISADEQHGYTPLKDLHEAPYDADNDISFYEGKAQCYFPVRKGEFVIYFPQDGHAPAITPTGLRKAIFKVRVTTQIKYGKNKYLNATK